jgi:phosphoribosyl-ATP pyrophosphohydrolase/phosphoribosyl-AMP cyclohydrolase
MIAEPHWGPDGLVPVVVQDEADGRVLMVAYADAEALAATLATAQLHFHSRSRDRLWRKGETSGNVLRVVDLALDCDGDAILATVRPSGPTCHRGTRSCFDPAPDADADVDDDLVPGDVPPRAVTAPLGPVAHGVEGFAWLETLWATIEDRQRRRPAGSYTTSLLEGGVDAAGRKVVEEAVEVLMAAKDDAVATGSGRDATAAALAGEAADLVYHALVLLAERDVAPAAVMEILRGRHGPEGDA